MARIIIPSVGRRPIAGLFVVLSLVVAAGLASVAGVAHPAGAQATPVAEDPVRTITVTGQGRVSVTPDAARVTVGVQIFNVSLSEAQSEATTATQAILDAAEAAGIAEDDIRTVNYNVSVIQDYDEQGNLVGVDGYQVGNQVELTIRDIDGLGSLLDQVVQAGANTIYGIGFFVSDPAEAASQARLAAVEDARAKADELAAALGVEVTGVISVAETSAPAPAIERMEVFADAQGAGASVPIAPGSAEVVVAVTITYEMG